MGGEGKGKGVEEKGVRGGKGKGKGERKERGKRKGSGGEWGPHGLARLSLVYATLLLQHQAQFGLNPALRVVQSA